MSEPARLRIDLWSDVVCPFCWIGKRRLEEAVRLEGLEGRVELVPRAFELDPNHGPSGPLKERLARKFGGPAQVTRVTQHVITMGSADGLRFDFDTAIAARTFDAHRLILFAREQGVGPRLMDRLAEAHFTERVDLADRDTLARIAAEVGLEPDAIGAVLDSEAYATEVSEEEALAREIGIQGVPFAILDGRLAVSGAQPVEVFREALRRAVAAAADPRPQE